MRPRAPEASASLRTVSIHLPERSTLDFHEEPLRDALPSFDRNRLIRNVLNLDENFVFRTMIIVVNESQ